jgi:hypothetical protein
MAAQVYQQATIRNMAEVAVLVPLALMQLQAKQEMVAQELHLQFLVQVSLMLVVAAVVLIQPMVVQAVQVEVETVVHLVVLQAELPI